MNSDLDDDRYRSLFENGESSERVYKVAKSDGLSKLDRIRIIRGLYSLSFEEAAAVASSVDGESASAIPAIGSRDELFRFLKDKLGYCNCASKDALATLQGFLQAVQDRTDHVNDSEKFSAASRQVEMYLDCSPEYSDWFVYGLENRELLFHGWRITDVWITRRGRVLLEAMIQFLP